MAIGSAARTVSQEASDRSLHDANLARLERARLDRARVSEDIRRERELVESKLRDLTGGEDGKLPVPGMSKVLPSTATGRISTKLSQGYGRHQDYRQTYLLVEKTNSGGDTATGGGGTAANVVRRGSRALNS